MKASEEFKSTLIAPCGIYCGVCYAHLREKNKCFGCRTDFDTKPKYCIQCRIANCDLLAKTKSGFCFECEKFPCQRLKQLDKRYRTKYNTGLIRNLVLIKEKGIQTFLKLEKNLRTCPDCGSLISVHRNNCTTCN